MRSTASIPTTAAPRSSPAGGYDAHLITATEQYVGELLRHAREPRPGDDDLRAFIAGPLAAGWVSYFPPYQRVHESNLAAVS